MNSDILEIFAEAQRMVPESPMHFDDWRRDRQAGYAREHYLENREETKARAVAWCKANPERHKESKREYNRRYYLAHRDEAKARAVAWKEANPERRREIRRAYYLRSGK